MILVELLKDHFQYMPGLYVHVVAEACMIWWTTPASAMDGSPYIDLSRDSLHIKFIDGVTVIKRVDCGDRILHDEPWKTLDPHNPKFIQEIHRMILSL